MVHIEVGAVLREVAKEDTRLGRKINQIINREKELVPDEIIGEVLHIRIKNIPAEKGVIVDGAPRKTDQVEEVESSLSENGRELDKVIFIAIPEQDSIERLSKRCACVVCKKKLVVESVGGAIKERCPDCGGAVMRREDDTPEGIKKRLKIFSRETLPVIDYYRQKGMLIEVDGKKEVRQVFKDITDKIEFGQRK